MSAPWSTSPCKSSGDTPPQIRAPDSEILDEEVGQGVGGGADARYVDPVEWELADEENGGADTGAQPAVGRPIVLLLNRRVGVTQQHAGL